jgi:hypothetical protein
MSHDGDSEHVAQPASSFFQIILWAVAGTALAIGCDLFLRGEAASVFTLNRWFAELFALWSKAEIPLWNVIALLLLIGATSAAVMRASGPRMSFAAGFGVLAALMMAAPPSVGSGLPAADLTAPDAASYPLALTIRFPNGLRNELAAMSRTSAIRAKLHNETTGETFNLFRTAGGNVSMRDDALTVRADIPASAKNAVLWVRIETSGYAIEIQSAEARMGELLEWRIDMRPSATPLAVQRLATSYWF